MSNIGKIIRVNALPPVGEREDNVIYQVAAPGAATYTDYAVDENGDIKTHAGNFDPKDLTDHSVNITTQQFLGESIATQEEFNMSIREKVNNKVEKPIINGDPQSYPKILGLDAYGNTAALRASDLGKNIANSSLTSVAGSGLILGADWAIETTGHQYSIFGLSDVSTNPAFDMFLSQDDSGKLGKTNGVQPFLSLPSTLSESEKIAWKTAMNGGWTTNTMSVAMVSPLVIDRTSNINTWVSLKGANLNLNPASFSVEIMNENGDTVVDQILSSQVQLYQNGIDLVFYYNFSNLPVGKYRIRVWNGVAYYITNSNLSINSVNSVSNIDTSALTWEVRSVPENNNTYTVGNGNIAKIMDETSQSSGSNYPVVSIKSSPFHDITDNFYIEMNVNYTIGTLVGNTLFELLPARIGLTYSDFNINSDVFNTVAYLAYKPFSGRGEANINTISPPFIAIASSDGVSSYSQKLTFIKNGNILYLIWSFNNQIYQIDLDSTRALSIIMQLPNWQHGLGNIADLTISKAYKF